MQLKRQNFVPGISGKRRGDGSAAVIGTGDRRLDTHRKTGNNKCPSIKVKECTVLEIEKKSGVRQSQGKRGTQEKRLTPGEEIV